MLKKFIDAIGAVFSLVAVLIGGILIFGGLIFPFVLISLFNSYWAILFFIPGVAISAIGFMITTWFFKEWD